MDIYIPDLLNLYGDRGNIQCMMKRCQWRGIDAETIEFTLEDKIDFTKLDIVLLGGGSDREQMLVCDRLRTIQKDFHDYVEDGGSVIAVCGGYQLLGHYYDTDEGRIEGLSLVDLYTEQGSPRLIDNIVLQNDAFEHPIVGFENHGGRTYIGENRPSEEYFMVMEIMEKMAQKVCFTKTWSALICTDHCFQKIHISVTI